MAKSRKKRKKFRISSEVPADVAAAIEDPAGFAASHSDEELRTVLGKVLSKPSSQKGQAAVQSYLYCLKRLMEAAQQMPETMRVLEPGADPQEGVRKARLLWAMMRNARIFEIPRDVVNAFNMTAAENLARQLGGAGRQLTGVRIDPRTDNFDRHSEELMRDVDLLGQDQPFPGPLPFSYTFLGFEDGLQLNEAQARMRVSHSNHNAWLLGYLLTDEPEPEIIELVAVEDLIRDDNYLLPSTHYHHGSWNAGRCMAPWVLGLIIDMLNSHRVVIEQSKPNLALKRTFKQQNKKTRTGMIPPPYFTIEMTDRYIDSTRRDSTNTGTGVKRTYRTDREGFERCHVLRGPLPLSAEHRTILVKRGYQSITTSGLLSAEDAERLSKRRKPVKRHDEWVAIRSTWIDETMSPKDPTLPYVPAVRVPKEHKERAALKRTRIKSILNPGED